jgi:hypothetical protein
VRERRSAAVLFPWERCLEGEIMVEKLIYRAGASSDIVRAEADIAALRAAGWKITFDWTVPVREAGDASPPDVKVRRAAAIADLKGVLGSNVLWLAQPEATSTSTGAWVELGIALGDANNRQVRGLPPLIMVVSGASRKCIFSDLADYRFESHDEALAFITMDLRL